MLALVHPRVPVLHGNTRSHCRGRVSLSTTTLKRRTQNAYYESPPHIPSTPMRRKTRSGARDSGKYPSADSDESVIKRIPWMIEGIGIARVGRAGSPMERDERDRNTVL